VRSIGLFQFRAASLIGAVEGGEAEEFEKFNDDDPPRFSLFSADFRDKSGRLNQPAATLHSSRLNSIGQVATC
jgi:hypothetical protein